MFHNLLHHLSPHSLLSTLTSLGGVLLPLGMRSYQKKRTKSCYPMQGDVVSSLPLGTMILGGLSSEIRDFSKQKTENEDKEETWTRLTELASFALGGFGSSTLDWAVAPTIENAKQLSYASLQLTKMHFGMLVSVSL